MKGKVAIVCGASRGMGRAIAEEFLFRGAYLTICARNEASLLTTMRNLGFRAVNNLQEREAVNRIIAIPGDVTNIDDLRRIVDETVDTYGTVHILVNNAGGPPSGYFENINDDDWYGAVDLMLMSVVRLIRLVSPYMKKQKWGRIINMTSMSVKQPIENLVLSNSIRLAVVGLAKTLASQWAKYGITINNIAPGPVRTKRIEELSMQAAERDGIEFQEALDRWISEVPAGRLGKPREVAKLAAFLADDDAGFITGTTIQIDGGAIRYVL